MEVDDKCGNMINSNCARQISKAIICLKSKTIDIISSWCDWKATEEIINSRQTGSFQSGNKCENDFATLLH